jgi:CSLREA domain-containing protein
MRTDRHISVRNLFMSPRAKRARAWKHSGFFRPIGEELEARTVLSGTPDYDLVAADWFQQVSPGVLGYAPRSFIGPLASAMGTAGGDWQSTADVAQWIVRLTPEAAQQAGSVTGVESLLNGDSDSFHVLRGLGLPGLVLVEANTSTEATSAALASNAGVAMFEANAYFTTQATPNDPDFPSLTGLDNVGQFGAIPGADINAPEAWNVDTGSTQIVVGVIDSGIDYTHPDLYLNIWINQGEIPAALKSQLSDTDADGRFTFYDLNDPANVSRVSDLNGNSYIDAGDLYADPRWTDGVDTDRNAFVDDLFGWNFRSAADEPNAPNDPQDLLGHGTHVAGTIGAIGNNNRGVTGVNWRTSMMALKFLDTGNSGQTADAVAAINYATLMREQFGEPIKVLNASFGQSGSESQALRNAIAAAGQTDMLLVAAAGNGNILGQGINLDRDPFFPASSDLANVISVAASGPSDELARFSNFGKVSVDLAAPGIGVLSTLPGGRYGTANGTSMAAPHVAGTAALIWSELPFATSAEIRQAILTTVDTSSAFNTLTSTGGRLNARQAIDSTVFAPRAGLVSVANPVVSVAGGVDNLITVTYHDRQGIDASTIGDGDIIATRHWGPRDTILATYVANSTFVTYSGTDVTASYRIAAPGGTWDPLDYGGYSLSVVAGQVKNVNGLYAPPDPFAEFSVRIADPTVFYINSFADVVDANVGNGVCAELSGVCTLRAAIQEANAAAPSPRTVILNEGIYKLTIPPVAESPLLFPNPEFLLGCYDGESTFISSDIRSGDLDISGQVTIVGDQTNSTMLDAGQIDRVLKIYPGASLSLSRATVTGGKAQAGAGILSAGTLNLDLTTVVDNTAATGTGGGLAVWGGQTQITGSTIRDNAALRGGGVFVCNQAAANIATSTLTANMAVQTGSAIASSIGGPVQISNSTISANQATAGAGIIGNAAMLTAGVMAVSGDGQFVVINSSQSDLVYNDTNGTNDLFVYDQQNGLIQKVGEPWFSAPAISADGRYIVYTAWVTSDTQGYIQTDIFVYDRQTGQAERINALTGGAFTGLASSEPTISADGRFVAFYSIPMGVRPGKEGIYLFDRQLAKLEWIAPGEEDKPSLSADGRFVAYVGFQNNTYPLDVYVYDRQSTISERVSVSDNGVLGNSDSVGPQLSADGRFVAFTSRASTLVSGDTNDASDIFLVDRQTHHIQRISVAVDGTQGNSYGSTTPTMSADGRFIVFNSQSTNLVPGDNNQDSDVFLYDRQASHIERISVATNGNDVMFAGSSNGLISTDGNTVAFSSYVDFLSSNPTRLSDSRSFIYDRPTRSFQILRTGSEHSIGLENVTVAGNSGFSTLSRQSTIHNSLVVQNTSLSSETGDFRDPFTVSQGYNITDKPSAGLTATDRIDPAAATWLGPLQDNGGPTWTYSLLPGSTAIDSADPTTLSGFDQRGLARPQNGDGLLNSRSDIGAFEAYYAEAHGAMFRDVNRNGRRDSDEVGLPGQRVYLDVNKNGTYDLGDLPASTSLDQSQTPAVSEAGNYSFTTLTSDAYWVAPIIPDGWTPTRTAANERVSISDSGLEGNDISVESALSGDARFVAFSSSASNLVPGDTNSDFPPGFILGPRDIFVMDRQTRHVERVNVTKDGTQAELRSDSNRPAISADGRFVAFVSTASNLVPGDTNNRNDVFVYDRQDRKIERISIANDGTQADGNSDRPSISADGRFIVFQSSAENLISGVVYGGSGVFLYDRQSRTLERISVDGGANPNLGSHSATISADGRFVALDIFDDATFAWNVYVYDRVSHVAQNISIAADGSPGGATSYQPSISGNGRYVAFASYANLSPDDNNHSVDLYLYDRVTSELQRISVNNDGTEWSSGSPFGIMLVKSDQAISADGRFVTFLSSASNIVPGDTNGRVDAFVYDRQIHRVNRISVADSGDQANSDSYESFWIQLEYATGLPTISSDGRFLSFTSQASNLIAGDSGFYADVFVTPNANALGAGTRSFSVHAGQVVSNIDFGIVPNPGQIQGRCFDDLIANGVDDAGEPGRAGCMIYLDLNSNGRFDSTDPSTTSAADGTFSFSNLESEMEYQVGLAEIPNGQTLVLPSANDNSIYRVYLPAGGTIIDRDFGLRPTSTTGQSQDASIQGRLFVAQSGGTKAGLAGIEVFVDLDDDGVRDFNEPRMTTLADNLSTPNVDESGQYTFAGLGSRPYTVRVLNTPANVLQTSPIGNSFAKKDYSLAVSYAADGSPKDVAVGDFNNDGWPDLAMPIFDRNVISILLNDQHGNFGSPIEISLSAVGRGPIALVAGNFNGTGGDDLAVANSYSSNVGILLDFNGTSFGSETYVSVASTPTSLASGDVLDADGDLDLIVTHSLANSTGTVKNVSLLRNAAVSQGSFSKASELSAGNNPSSVAIGNFNGDARPDFAVTDYGTHPTGSDPGDVRVFLANADGTYQSSIACSVGFGPAAVVAQDLNGDQKVDLAITNFLTDNITVCLGQGNGVFQALPSPLPGGSGPLDIAASDIDGDGDFDLLFTNSKSQKISILRNRLSQSSFGFDPAESFGAAVIPGFTSLSLAIGDFNRDQMQDLAAANSLQNVVAIHQNNLIGGAHRLALTGIETVAGVDFKFQQINLPPTLASIANLAAVNEDALPLTVNLSGIGAGAGESQPLQISVTTNNPALIVSATPQYQSPSTTGSVALTLGANQSGQAAITITVTDGGLDKDLSTTADNASVQQMFTLTVNPLNDLPTLDPLPAILLIDKNAATQTINLTGISAGGGESQPLRVTATTNNPAWIQNLAAQYAGTGAAATVTYTTPSGTSTGQITITLTDGGLDNNLDTIGDNLSVTHTVTPVTTNNPPSVALANPVTSLAENTSTVSQRKLAEIVVTDDGVGGQILSLSGADARFFEIVGTELFLNAGAALDFETRPLYTAIVTVDDPTVGATPDATAMLTLNITNINEPPSVSLLNPLALLPENSLNATPQKVADILVIDDGVNNLSLTGPDAALFEIVNQSLQLVAGVMLDYETQSRLQLTVVVDDPDFGGAGDASVDYVLAISDVNEQPTELFLSNSRISTLADSSAGPIFVGKLLVVDDDRSPAGYAFDFVAGTGDSDNSLFVLSGSGLSLRQGTSLLPAGSSYLIRVRLTDGPFTLEESFEILVTSALAINHAPSFLKGADPQGITDESGLVSLPAWVTAISPGNGDSALQTVEFIVTTDNPGFFSVQPAIDTSGELTFTPKPNQVGVAQVSVIAKDDGGTASGGVDQSAAQTFAIAITKKRVWHNADIPQDVTGDRAIVAGDVLEIINYINAKKPDKVPTDGRGGGPYYDVTGDGTIAADDVIAVINRINSGVPLPPEAEPTSLRVLSTAATHDHSIPLELLDLLATDLSQIKRRLRA